MLAVDGDRGVNNEISYSIVQGPSDIFGIDSKTGIIFTQNELDRESERSRESNGAFILGIRAREVGGRQLDQYIDTEVTIIIEVRNEIKLYIKITNQTVYQSLIYHFLVVR